MARGELYLESPNGVTKLYLAQTLSATVSPSANWGSFDKTNPYGGVQSINRVFSKSPIVIPIPDQEPLGIDINMIESDTIKINTLWFDGIGDNSNYVAAEAFFLKTGWNSADKMKPYRFQMGEREYWVMLNSWTADLTGGWGDTIPITLSLSIVASM